MSKESFQTANKAVVKAVGIKKIILKKGNPSMSIKMPLTKVRDNTHNVLYESTEGDFLGNINEKVTLLNVLNINTNCSRTLAFYTTRDTHCTKLKTSDSISQLIGQKHYDILLAALCSVMSVELKIRGILALLTEPMTEVNKTIIKVDKEVQTLEMMNIKKVVKRKRARQTFCPYVVTDEIKPDVKVIIDPEDVISKRVKIENVEMKNEEIPPPDSTKTLIDLRDIIGTSNLSVRSVDEISLSGFSMASDIESVSLLDTIDKCTETGYFNSDEKYNFTLYDGSTIALPMKPEDCFHLASPETLQGLSVEDKKKLMMQQLLYDFRHCMDRDEDNNLPLHEAAMNNDGDLVSRLCVVLKKKQESVDLPGMAIMSALHMAIKRKALQCLSILLQNGACPLLEANDSKTALHLAAEINCESSTEAIISHCNKYPRMIMEENEMWDEKYANSSIQDLASMLLYKMSMKCDCQGYTPLMLACKKGHHDVVKHLVKICGNSINMPSPNSGDTALFIAVGAACIDTERRNNESKVAENYSKTIKTLVENGADPSILNKSGHNVTTLLTDFNNNELSLLVANTLTSVKYFDGKMPANLNSEKYILLKEGGKILSYAKNDAKRNSETENSSNDLLVATKSIKLESPVEKCAKIINDKSKSVANSIVVVKPGNTSKYRASVTADNAKDKVRILQNVKVKKLLNSYLTSFTLKKVSPQAVIRLNPAVRDKAVVSKIAGKPGKKKINTNKNV